MPYLTLAQGKDRLLDACAKLTSARDDLTAIEHQLGLGEGKRDIISSVRDDLVLHLRWLIAIYDSIVLEPDTKSAGAE